MLIGSTSALESMAVGEGRIAGIESMTVANVLRLSRAWPLITGSTSALESVAVDHGQYVGSRERGR
ncbi:hypothetical protein ACQKLN_12310 [Paenibacillus glucanolyticus]|uniref:hypothetical protein n=1 Tax=Paenibacillus glucanolyticus TaxID=59843 RepID=UPI0036943967